MEKVRENQKEYNEEEEEEEEEEVEKEEKVENEPKSVNNGRERLVSQLLEDYYEYDKNEGKNKKNIQAATQFSEQVYKNLIDLMTKENALNKEKKTNATKEYFVKLINTIKNLEDKDFVSILRYLKGLKILIPNILINGYLQYDFDQGEKELDKKMVLNTIKKSINFSYNKDTFNEIYSKLSEMYRKSNDIKSVESVNKFKKLMDVWELLYSFDNYTPISWFPLEKDIIPNILLFPQNQNNINKNDENKNNINENISILLKDKPNITEMNITIGFMPSQILNLNKYVENSGFFKFYENNEVKCEIKYIDIFSKNNSATLESMEFKFKNGVYTILCNNDKNKILDGKLDINSISKIEILNNFYGEIKFVNIECKDNNVDLEIKKLSSENGDCKIVKHIFIKDGEKKNTSRT